MRVGPARGQGPTQQDQAHEPQRGDPALGHEHGRNGGDEEQLDDAGLGQSHVAAGSRPAGADGAGDRGRKRRHRPEPTAVRHDQTTRPLAPRREGPPPEGVSAHRYDDPPVQLPGVTPRAFLRITQVTVVIVVLNIVTGAAVRLSDSGLGCPDWPTCSKHHLTPPLSLHPAIEFGNRMVVVVLCVATAIALLAAPAAGAPTARPGVAVGGPARRGDRRSRPRGRWSSTPSSTPTPS